jgi:hypothetical protein
MDVVDGEYETFFTICHDILRFVDTISVEPIDTKTMTGDWLHQRMFS